MPEIEESVSLDLTDLGGGDTGDSGDSGADPFDSLLTEVFSRGDDSVPASEPAAKEEKADTAADAADEEKAEAPADAGDDADKPADDKPAGKPPVDDNIDPQESDLKKEGEKSWVEPHRWKAMLRLRDAAKPFAVEPEDGRPLTIRSIRESLEQLAPVVEVVKAQGLTTADDIREALAAAEYHKASVADFTSEDPADRFNFLEQWRREYPEAFGRIVVSMPAYLADAQPEALAGIAEQLPDLIPQLDGNTQFRVMDRIVGGMSSDLERKAREFASDTRLNEEDRLKGATFYVNAIQAMEYELYGKHRSWEQILGGQMPQPTQPDPRDEQLRKMQEERAREQATKVEQFQQQAFTHIAQAVSGKISGKADELLKPFAEAKFPKIVMDNVRDKVMQGIKQTVAKNFRTEVALTENKFKDLVRSKSSEEVRNRLSTLVEDHGTIVSRAAARFRTSPEFAEIRKQLAESRKVEVQKREAVQQRAPVPASNSQAPQAKVVDVRNAATLDEGIDALFSNLNI